MEGEITESKNNREIQLKVEELKKNYYQSFTNLHTQKMDDKGTHSVYSVRPVLPWYWNQAKKSWEEKTTGWYL